ncbi:hypothetical protein GYMLUDRAFT_258998 [Collybiopsis luxurians FD-317 M1]|uniref:Uncharacterized protein n=1 Tax=Collybiopsis luxurians FD-317 M1 TaxID=944289 RepID=A0A0D0BIK7_9AGAR|nr:hypothetical protein GYMLUDRAFT_258998 [Collybiopsis luxurians FD-317 M1]
MSTQTKLFRRGRINAEDLIEQDPVFISDYAERYDISSNIPVKDIVARIFQGKTEFIPILPNHTWKLEGDRIMLTGRREPPKHPDYLASGRSPKKSGSQYTFPEPPEDTYSRSPSPVSDDLPNKSSTHPVPENNKGAQPAPVVTTVQHVYNGYYEGRVKFVTEVQALTEEIEKLSADTVRVLGEISQERDSTRQLLKAVEVICGKEFLDNLMRDVHATTNFELNKTFGTNTSFQSAFWEVADSSGGKIRSKKPTNKKEIFSVSGGSDSLLNQPGAHSANATSQAASSSEQSSPEAGAGPSAGLPASSQDASASTSTQSGTASTQPAGTSTLPQPRRPRPLQRNYERLYMNPDGTLELKDYRTPEWLERMKEQERQMQKASDRYAVEAIVKESYPRYPVGYIKPHNGDFNTFTYP